MVKKESLKSANIHLEARNKFISLIRKIIISEWFNISFIIGCTYVILSYVFKRNLYLILLAIAVYFVYQEIKGDIIEIIDKRSQK